MILKIIKQYQNIKMPRIIIGNCTKKCERIKIPGYATLIFLSFSMLKMYFNYLIVCECQAQVSWVSQACKAHAT